MSVNPIRSLLQPGYKAETIEQRLLTGAIAFDVTRAPVVTLRLRTEARLFAYTDPRGTGTDRLRFLRHRLNQLRNPEKLKRLLITSPLPHDGKSTIALNLAIILAEGGRRNVLLVEGDLHRPTISAELELAGKPGLAECLETNINPGAFIRRIEPLGFYFLPSGNVTNDPSELLQRSSLQALMAELSAPFDWVLIDSPPVAPLTDSLSWKEGTDATLLVVRAGVTPTSDTEEAVNLIGRRHILAIVLNGLEGLERVYKKYYKAYKSR